MNLRIDMGMVVKMIMGNKNQQNININVDSDAKACWEILLMSEC